MCWPVKDELRQRPATGCAKLNICVSPWQVRCFTGRRYLLVEARPSDSSVTSCSRTQRAVCASKRQGTRDATPRRTGDTRQRSVCWRCDGGGDDADWPQDTWGVTGDYRRSCLHSDGLVCITGVCVSTTGWESFHFFDVVEEEEQCFSSLYNWLSRPFFFFLPEMGASLICLNLIWILNPCSPPNKDAFISQLLLPNPQCLPFFPVSSPCRAANRNNKVNYDLKKKKIKKAAAAALNFHIDRRRH